MTGEFSGKTVLVTGGAGPGCGAALCRGFLHEGAVVIALDRHEGRLAQLRSDLSGQQRLHTIRADLREFDLLAARVTEVAAEAGWPDILVNNAAVNSPKPMFDYTDADFTETIDVDFVGCWRMAGLLVPKMKERGQGVVLNMSSVAAYTAAQGSELPYSASKAALHNFTRALAADVGPFGIRANALALGAIATPWVERNAEALGLDAVIGRTPLRRLGRVSEVVGASLFLCSERASFITGEVLNVSGGVYLSQ